MYWKQYNNSNSQIVEKNDDKSGCTSSTSSSSSTCWNCSYANEAAMNHFDTNHKTVSSSFPPQIGSSSSSTTSVTTTTTYSSISVPSSSSSSLPVPISSSDCITSCHTCYNNNNNNMYRNRLFWWWKLRELGLTSGGYCSDSIRQRVWPILVVEPLHHQNKSTNSTPFASEASTPKKKESIPIKINPQHVDYDQIQLDVARNSWVHLVEEPISTTTIPSWTTTTCRCNTKISTTSNDSITNVWDHHHNHPPKVHPSVIISKEEDNENEKQDGTIKSSPPPPPPSTTTASTANDNAELVQIQSSHKKQQVLLYYIHQTLLVPTNSSRKRHTGSCENNYTTPTKHNDSNMLRYYQGYHDYASIIVSVLLQQQQQQQQQKENNDDNVGSDMIQDVLYTVSYTHMIDYMDVDFIKIRTTLQQTIFPLLYVMDNELYTFLVKDCHFHEPYFALSWILTWFAHDLLKPQQQQQQQQQQHEPSNNNLQHNDDDQHHHQQQKQLNLIKRIYDFLIVSHPLMSLYMSVALLIHPTHRTIVLDETIPHDFAEAHGAVSKLPLNLVMMIGSDDCAIEDDCNHPSNPCNDASWNVLRQSLPQQQQDNKDEHCLPTTTTSSGHKDLRCVSVEEVIQIAIRIMEQIPPHKLFEITVPQMDNDRTDNKNHVGDDKVTDENRMMLSEMNLFQPLQLCILYRNYDNDDDDEMIHMDDPSNGSTSNNNNNDRRDWTTYIQTTTSQTFHNPSFTVVGGTDQSRSSKIKMSHRLWNTMKGMVSKVPSPQQSKNHPSFDSERTKLIQNANKKKNMGTLSMTMSRPASASSNRYMVSVQHDQQLGCLRMFLQEQETSLAVIAAGFGRPQQQTTVSITKNRRTKWLLKKRTKKVLVTVVLVVVVVVLVGTTTIVRLHSSDFWSSWWCQWNRFGLSSTASTTKVGWYQQQQQHEQQIQEEQQSSNETSVVVVVVQNENDRSALTESFIEHAQREVTDNNTTRSLLLDDRIILNDVVVADNHNNDDNLIRTIVVQEIETNTINTATTKNNTTTTIANTTTTTSSGVKESKPVPMFVFSKSSSFVLFPTMTPQSTSSSSCSSSSQDDDDDPFSCCFWMEEEEEAKNNHDPTDRTTITTTTAATTTTILTHHKDHSSSHAHWLRRSPRDNDESSLLSSSSSSLLLLSSSNPGHFATAKTETTPTTTNSYCIIAGKVGQLLCLIDGSQFCRPIINVVPMDYDSDNATATTMEKAMAVDLLDLSLVDIVSIGPCRQPDRDKIVIRCPLEYGPCGNHNNTVDGFTMLICNRTSSRYDSNHDRTNSGPPYNMDPFEFSTSTTTTATTTTSSLPPKMHQQYSDSTAATENGINDNIVRGYEVCLPASTTKESSILFEAVVVVHQHHHNTTDDETNETNDKTNEYSNHYYHEHICGCCDGFDPDIDFAGKCHTPTSQPPPKPKPTIVVRMDWNDPNKNPNVGNHHSCRKQHPNNSNQQPHEEHREEEGYNPCCHPCRSQVPLLYRPCWCGLCQDPN